MTTYATYSEFTQVYSLQGITEAQINSYWLPHGALRVNEELGGLFTIPFSDNNQSAKDLSIHYAYLGILTRTQKTDDSDELEEQLDKRIQTIIERNAMVLTDGSRLSVDGSIQHEVWSNTQDFKPVFDMRQDIDQRVDPDLIDQNWSDDK